MVEGEAMKIIVEKQDNGSYSVTHCTDEKHAIQPDLCRDEVIAQVASIMITEKPFYAGLSVAPDIAPVGAGFLAPRK